MQPRVVDLSHHNVVTDFGAVARSGIWGVIHKATQGCAYADPDYAGRRVLADNTGLLWGAYHFGTGDDVKAQVRWFLDKAKPDAHTLMVLDFEANRLSQMRIEQAVDWLRQVKALTGREAAIYSGTDLKEAIDDLSLADQAYVCSHRLWLAQYGTVAKLPQGFSKWWLWQFTDGQVGPLPHSVPGIKGPGIDINTYAGTLDQLKRDWVS